MPRKNRAVKPPVQTAPFRVDEIDLCEWTIGDSWT